MNQNPSGSEPWYAPANNKKKSNSSSVNRSSYSAPNTEGKFRLLLVSQGVISIVLAVAAGFYLQNITSGTSTSPLFSIAIAAVFLIVAILFLLRQVGVIISTSLSRHANDSSLSLALRMIRGEIRGEDVRKGTPAPEMALFQFVQQVRAYATEKSFQKTKLIERDNENHLPLIAEPVDLLKRRWNEVTDSLSEFEIYLANDPQGLIAKLIAKYPVQMLDVSQVFRDVAESFDNTWRRKGINIESAIVTPLKATANEALLRRMLVGPWRSCAYFARRGGGVLFSAKSVDGKVAARWECDGLMIPEEFVQFAMQTDIPVNDRIERGLIALSPDPNSPNTLFALISFITWIDLAKSCNADFAFKHTNDGFAIELNLR